MVSIRPSWLWAAQIVFLFSTACAAEQDSRRVSFLAFGDSGYIPAYDVFDPDEEPFRTPEDFLRDQIADWLEDHNPLEDFVPEPMTFETSLGSYVAASGLYPTVWAMERYCATAHCDFAVMLGDNIYPDGATLGADGISDARRFDDMFVKPFANLGADSDSFKIYATLGNHDWHISREATMAQVAFLESHPKFYMDGLFYRVTPAGTNGMVELFVIDTEVMLAGTTVYDDELMPDGSERPDPEIDEPDPWTRPQNEAERNMAQWLEDALESSDARWKIVIAHHPLWSSSGGKYEQARALRKLILPMLCRHADAYLAGHEHTLEVHTDSCEGVSGAPSVPLTHLVSGAAAKQRPLHRPFMAHQARNNPQYKLLWAQAMVWGFMHVTLDGDVATVRVITTPNDGSGVPVIEADFTFPRRNGRQ